MLTFYDSAQTIEDQKESIKANMELFWTDIELVKKYLNPKEKVFKITVLIEEV